jgi:hypothetical protein
MNSDGAVNTKGQAILAANNGQIITYTTSPEDIIILMAVLQIVEE